VKITIYGYGYVGKAVARFLADHYELQIVDPNPNCGARVLHDSGSIEPTEFAILCAPTPMRADGSCETAIIEKIIGAGAHDHYLVKSTVPPGTTERLQAMLDALGGGKTVCFSPEYIGEGTYNIPWWKDFAHPTDIAKHSFHIFGGPSKAPRRWVEIWQRVAGWVPRYAQTDSRTAELVKYAENMFLAAKKTFCTELYRVAEAMGVDYQELRELWLLDARIGTAMTLVFADKLAFGGKCLPKDTQALVQASMDHGYFPKLFQDVIDRNKEFAALDREAEQAATSPGLRAVHEGR